MASNLLSYNTHLAPMTIDKKNQKPKSQFGGTGGSHLMVSVNASTKIVKRRNGKESKTHKIIYYYLDTTLIASYKDPHYKLKEGLLSNFDNSQPYIRP